MWSRQTNVEHIKSYAIVSYTKDLQKNQTTDILTSINGTYITQHQPLLLYGPKASFSLPPIPKTFSFRDPLPLARFERRPAWR